ncbi:MAG: GNAT family N-acetyltransferase [Eubacteriales bacterium]|nr:GNAT family N-acetyltransferase [Eubacteriales bacterium]
MLRILPLDARNRGALNQADTRYLAGDRVQVRVTHMGFVPQYAPLATAEWRQLSAARAFDADKLLADPKAACFLAYEGSVCVGQSVAHLVPHRLCELWDLRVDSQFRRQGVATALLEHCMEWARAQGRAGMRVETSDDHPVLCQFLQSCGFTLGGVDKLWHRADAAQQDRPAALRESVLTFYRFF